MTHPTVGHFTGLLDRDLERIYLGDLLWTKTRRHHDLTDHWTLDRVIWMPEIFRPGLAHPQTGELMAMQSDQELRSLARPMGV